MNSRTRKIAIAILLAIAAALTLTSCSSVSTQPDEVVLVYEDGARSDKKFIECISAGTYADVGSNDRTFSYHSGQRTYDFNTTENEAGRAETRNYEVISSDNTKMSVKGTVTFTFNTNCETLKKFHEAIGLKYNAFHDATDANNVNDAGWVNMLNQYVGKQADKALDAASRPYGWRLLYSDPTTKQEVEKKAGELFASYIVEVTGDQYFCGPTFDGKTCGVVQFAIDNPEPPAALVATLNAEQNAKQRTAAQSEENKRVAAELDSMEKQVKILGPEWFVLREALEKGQIKEVYLNPGGNSPVLVPRK